MTTEGWDLMVKRGWTETDTGCWEYLGYRNPNGYGRVHTAKGRVGAHRVSFEQHSGPIPEGHYVRHKCDNPPCVNPEHLESGTPKENMEDRDARGRGPQLDKNPFAKLTSEIARRIRERHASGEKTSRIAQDLGVHYSTVRRVINGERWRVE